MAYISINPYTDKINAEFRQITDSMLEEKIQAAHYAFKEWRTLPVSDRVKPLLKLASLLELEKEEHGRIMTNEMGKPFTQAVAEAQKCAMACRYYAENAGEILADREVSSSGHTSRVSFSPQGIVFAVMPWNFPYWQVIRCIAPAMASGNAVLLKHASNVPLSADRIERLVAQAGFPEGLFANLFIDHDQASKVLESPYVRSVSLTGSNRAGEVIASRAGSNIKKCVLELGGSDPIVIFPDAKLPEAVDGAVTGRFQNNGQSCIAAKRLFIQESVYPEVLNLLKHRVDNLRVGDPMDAGTYIGPLVNEAAVAELHSQVTRSVEMGAEIITGGVPGDPGKCFYRPTIIINAPYDSPIAMEETFGPVLPVFTFSGYDEMIEKVNSTEFGLGSSVWTNDKSIMDKVARDIDAGTVTINGFTRSDPLLPFGGVKSSGYGRELSDFGMLEFVNIKTVTRLID